MFCNCIINTTWLYIVLVFNSPFSMERAFKSLHSTRCVVGIFKGIIIEEHRYSIFYHRWMAAQGMEALKPLYEKLVIDIKNQGYLQVDETTIKVLDEKKKGKS